MFRRTWSGLPQDPIFPSNFEDLGFVSILTSLLLLSSLLILHYCGSYFVNDQDEIRLINDPKLYYKFFTWRNERWNERQRFHFNEAVERLIHERLEAEHLKKHLLPFGSKPNEPHVPIFASEDVASKSRVVIIFGQSEQELGVLAHRIIGGPGGINKGSMVSIVKAMKEQKCSKTDVAGPGVILANMGELWWWPEGERALNDRSRLTVPMKSQVHRGRYYDPQANAAPGNATPEQHVAYMFEEVIPKLVDGKARIDVVLLGDATDFVEGYLDEKWATWGPRLNSLSIVGGLFDKKLLQCEGFKKFLAEVCYRILHVFRIALMQNSESSRLGCLHRAPGPPSFRPPW